jgi:Fe-S cluster biogenesis protein NfuA
MKFVANVLLLPDASAEYLSAEEAEGAPLVQALFQFPYTQAVYISHNFITLTKKPAYQWTEIILDVRPFLKEWLESGRDIIITLPPKKKPEALTPSDFDTASVEGRIRAVLDEYVRPAVQSDGGEIALVGFRDGVVTVQLKGSCSGCPSSTVTLKNGIEHLLKQMVPEVREVVAEEA